MKILLFLIAGSLSWGAVCTTTGTTAFDWDTPARWSCGHTPIDGTDTAVLGTLVEVTIPSGTTVTVGNFVGNAITISTNMARLVVSGTLRVKGHLNLTATQSKFAMITTGSFRPTLDLMSTSGLTSTATISGGSGQNEFSIAGTSAFPALITTTPGTGLPGFMTWPVDMGVSAVTPYGFTWNWVEINGLGSSTQNSITNLRGLAGGNIAMINCGAVTQTVIAAGSMNVNGLHIRGPLNVGGTNMWVYNHTAGAGTRHIQNITIAGTKDQIFTISADSPLLDDVIVYNSVLRYLTSTTQGNAIFRRILWVGQNGNSNNDDEALFVTKDSNFLLEESGFFHFTPTFGTQDNVGHEVKFAGTTPNLGQNIFRDIVIDGGGDHTGDGMRSIGDWILPDGTVLLQRILAFNGFGNVIDGFGPLPIQTVKNVTTVDATAFSPAAGGGIILAEGVGLTGMARDYRNNLMVNASSGIGQGGNFLRQTNFTLDHNASFNLDTAGSDAYMFNPAATTVRTYLATPVAANTLSATPCTVATSPAPTPTSFRCTVGNAALGVVMIGDYVKTGVYAIVTGVTDNSTSTDITVDVNLQGTDGIVGITPTTPTLTLHRGYWADGTMYGDGTHGLGDLLETNPHLVNRLADVATYDAMCGGPGTMDSFSSEAVKRYGNLNTAGAASTWNPCYSREGVMAYLRNSYAPRNPALIAAGNAADGSPDIGAIPVLRTWGPIAGMIQ